MQAAFLFMGILIDTIGRKFADVHSRSVQILSMTGEDDLYRRPRELPQTFTMFTVGEHLLRSAASVEQTFGGITTRLWDDPFEWTLPEKLNTISLVAEYLEEVEGTRQKGFAFLKSDDDLQKTNACSFGDQADLRDPAGYARPCRALPGPGGGCSPIFL